MFSLDWKKCTFAIILEDDEGRKGRDGDLKAGGQSWNNWQVNEINTSCDDSLPNEIKLLLINIFFFGIRKITKKFFFD